jgi:thiamine biosynthesis lipoprotein
MGTTFTVKVVAENLTEANQIRLQRLIEDELRAVNGKMSHYLEDSELSQFNRSRETTPFVVSQSTLEVFRHAAEVSALTGGAFDITAGPLINIWGFGPEGHAETLPSDAEIARALKRSGYDKLEIDEENATVRKKRPDLYCDLSAIAKGYGVDRVAESLDRDGLTNYMVEVGGEVRTSGTNDSGNAWRIAIEQPVPGQRAIQRIVPLSGLAMATSGGYRNFYDVDGARFSHTIDPRTGRPITHRLASVSVVDELSVRADALATGLLVLGPDEGYKLGVDRNIAALFLIEEEGGEFQELATPAFQRLLDAARH